MPRSRRAKFYNSILSQKMILGFHKAKKTPYAMRVAKPTKAICVAQKSILSSVFMMFLML